MTSRPVLTRLALQRALLAAICALSLVPSYGQVPPSVPVVQWTTPSADSTGSMPLGNGDVGLNVWLEPSGDLVFYIGKTDAWGMSQDVFDPGKRSLNLLKVGRVRISMSPAPALDNQNLRWSLDPARSEIRATLGSGTDAIAIHVWVDAHRPVIHVSAKGARDRHLAVTAEPWRTDPDTHPVTDRFVQNQAERLTWYYRNPAELPNPRVRNLTFGASFQGEGLARRDERTLTSSASRRDWYVTGHITSARTDDEAAWLTQHDEQIKAHSAVDPVLAYADHLEMWREFWSRSWIVVDGPQSDKVTQGYALQRYISACAGRGSFPLKFNGSIFVSDLSQTYTTRAKPDDILDRPANADYRKWGGGYWFQNTRPLYWPMIAAGDIDLMRPLFDFYLAILKANQPDVQKLYGHGGSYFNETVTYGVGLSRIRPEDPPTYTRHYYFPVLELTAIALDVWEHTRDDEFLESVVLPLAVGGIAFYDEHFARDDGGKILLYPVNSAETFWKTKNPTPDIAALRFLIPRLSAIESARIPATERNRWQRLLSELPPLPIGDKEGRKVLLPAHEFGEPKNSENPELYAVYPFRLFGVGKPELSLARDTFELRRIKRHFCWHPDLILAAYLGEAATARQMAIDMYAAPDRGLRFPAFWGRPRTHDYWPDQDHGGNAMQGLQKMVLQAEGRQIHLLPAWPADWDVSFKLHAPDRTTVEGEVRNGKVARLRVSPASRRADIKTVFGSSERLAELPSQ